MNPKLNEAILYPLITEKAINMIEKENKLTFIVEQGSTKPIVKKEVEEKYKVKVISVNILRDMKGRKKAVVRLGKEFKAQDLAVKLGVI